VTLLLSSFVVLQVLDVLTTVVGLRVGCVELNPMYAALGTNVFFGVKGVYTVLAASAFMLLPNWTPVWQLKWTVLTILVVAALVVVVWNAFVLVQSSLGA